MSVKEVKQVHRTARKDTTDLIIKGLTQHCILKGNNRRQQLRDMHTILQSTGLLTMLLEQRTVPGVYPLGYTPPRVIMVTKQNIRHNDIDDDLLSIASTVSNADTEAIAISEDDYCLFQHDQARLMLLVPLMFHASYYPHGETTKQKKDPVGFYKSIHSYVFGKSAIDLHNAMSEMLRFVINTHKSVREEYVRWTEVMQNVDDINSLPMSEEQ